MFLRRSLFPGSLFSGLVLFVSFLLRVSPAKANFVAKIGESLRFLAQLLAHR